MSNYLFTICGRSGSKGIKGKNSSDFIGAPLVYYTLAAISLYRDKHPENNVVVALNTDSQDLRKLVDGTRMDYEFIPRSAELAGDDVSKVDVIRETYHQVVRRTRVDFDAIVDLDITSPLRTVDDIETLLAKRKNSDAGVVFTVTQSRRNPYFNMVKQDQDGTCSRVIDSDFTARQQAPAVYDMNASMYAYSSDFLQGDYGIFDAPCDFTIMEDTAVLDLDNPGDLELMQIIAQHLFEKDARFREVRETAQRIGEL